MLRLAVRYSARSFDLYGAVRSSGQWSAQRFYEGVRQTHTAAVLTPVREPCTVPVAGAAPWRAALREPEDGLANRAGVGAVRTADLQRFDDPRSRSLFAVGPSRQLGVDGIARRRRDHGAMGGGRRDAGQDGSGAQGSHLLLELSRAQLRA